ncbi:MAG: radical SAM family heme chaperone HemW [Muribaculaceae bacterium]|nr:radical SAM family heme chaperone HemW [Muribaculaceae bacterium]
MSGVYIHIPFCRHKCLYCDFYSIGSKSAPWKGYIQAILDEATARAEEWRQLHKYGIGNLSHPDTLYIGGGTPSQMPAELLGKLITGITATFEDFNPVEVTMEVNPEDVNDEICFKMLDAGVNRVSMGIQSLQDNELRAVGRVHTAARALSAYTTLRRHFSNISIDLIFGLPLQTHTSWTNTLDKAIALDAEHVSAYSLMWEERTALYKMQQLGKVKESDESLSEQMFITLTDKLRTAGYEHYEISNYAKPGYRSRHNSSYWVGTPYIGLGAAAHSYDGQRIRRANPADVRSYIERLKQAQAPIYTEEYLTDDELREEYIMTRLRRCEGIDTSDFRTHFGDRALRELLAKARRHPELIHLQYGADKMPQFITLSPDAIMRSDTAIVSLF